MDTPIYPIILCGGAGTRLWPLSREHHPKQLLALTGGRTFLQDTACRLDGVDGIGQPLIVCNEEYRFLVTAQLREVGKTAAHILLEPVGRNTAPALTLAALALVQDGQDPVMLAMPADHVIRDPAQFHAAVGRAARLARAGHLVTFGIKPTHPETGYGYIKQGKDNDVAAFVEKPDLAKAQAYLASGEYLWNSGVFMMRARVWLDELGKQRPDILAACEGVHRGAHRDGEFVRMPKALMAQCPADSIDYAVMEKTARAKVVALDAGWSDVGAWAALWQVCPQDAQGNVVLGDVCAHQVKNSLLVSRHRLLAAVGVDDLVVIETADAVLVARKDQTQDVKAVVETLKRGAREEYKHHRRVDRPWGYYETVDTGERFQVKRILVNPGAALSLQMHHHRAEHWVVVKGTAKVTRGEEILVLSENQSTFIPLGMQHRLENPGHSPLEIIEVQSGGYLGEDDIVRFEDKYNRGNS